MRRHRTPWFTYPLAVFFAAFFLIPVIYAVMSAFKPVAELRLIVPTFFPRSLTLDNFRSAWNAVPHFPTVLFNTFLVAVSSTALAVTINTMSGYALAKFRFKGDTLILMIILATIMLPLEVIMVPIFRVLRFFGMYNSLWALIIPPAATPAGIFLMRQFLLTIPNDLIESARIDGASEWKIFYKIIVPNAKPAIATIAIFSFMWRWNDYIWPLIAISSPRKYTLQLAIATFQGQYQTDWSSLLATSAISMIPMLIIFLIFQRQFVQGTVETGMKG
ncbi:MAG: carbohydrate ABC transporter permease [Acholeplasmatales bacterium]|nr:MAG: carbohydrate ABC transporter permease [Acholeplasmatales bacterium]